MGQGKRDILPPTDILFLKEHSQAYHLLNEKNRKVKFLTPGMGICFAVFIKTFTFAVKLNLYKMNDFLSNITIDPKIRSGKHIIKGTRITIDDILHRLDSGMKVQEILEDFPLLKVEHIWAALAFAAYILIRN